MYWQQLELRSRALFRRHQPTQCCGCCQDPAGVATPAAGAVVASASSASTASSSSSATALRSAATTNQLLPSVWSTWDVLDDRYFFHHFFYFSLISIISHEIPLIYLNLKLSRLQWYSFKLFIWVSSNFSQSNWKYEIYFYGNVNISNTQNKYKKGRLHNKKGDCLFSYDEFSSSRVSDLGTQQRKSVFFSNKYKNKIYWPLKNRPIGDAPLDQLTWKRPSFTGIGTSPRFFFFLADSLFFWAPFTRLDVWWLWNGVISMAVSRAAMNNGPVLWKRKRAAVDRFSMWPSSFFLFLFFFIAAVYLVMFRYRIDFFGSVIPRV